MHRSIFVPMFFVLLFSGPGCLPAGEPASKPSVELAPADWPWWRGPNRNGIADKQQDPPVEWSAEHNVLWQAKVPGRGHGSPTVVGDRVFLATADAARDNQTVLAFNRQTGKLLWETVVHRGGLSTKGNGKASQASATVACDGERLYINFLNGNAIHTTAIDLHGKQIWQTKITDYQVHQGYGSSPLLLDDLVIVSADNKSGGALAALNSKSGKIVWRHDRPKMPNYVSPILLNVADREQLVFAGCEMVSSYEPRTGKKLWEFVGSTTEVVTSVVTDGKLIFISGGYPKNHVAAVRGDGSGDVVWEQGLRVYVPSMLVQGKHLFAVTDAGVAMCLDCETGEEIWKGRLGGTFSASPILVGEHIYATNEKGRTFIFKADPEKFVLVGTNQLGDHVMATPTICGGRIYMRAATDGASRQEILYCLSK